MARGLRGGRRRGARGGGGTPRVASTPEVLTPKDKRKSLDRRILLWGMWLG
jgi:hypothetical protein